MITFLVHLKKQQLALFFCGLLMVSLVYSPFLLSVSMIALIVISIFNLKWSPKVSLSVAPDLMRRFLQHKGFLVVTTFFFIVLLSGVLTEDFDYWGERLRLKLPFLLIPFAFANLPAFSKRQHWGLFYFLLVLLFVTCIGIGVNYMLNFEAINESILQGKPIPTPRHHIRFSLLLALGIIGGLSLVIEKFYWKAPWERGLVIGMTAFLFIFIHVLSVRSGLMVLYSCIVFLIGYYVIKTRRYYVGLGLMGLIIAIPILAFILVPSFKNKVYYAIWDIQMYQSGSEKGQNYSDTARMTSLEIGLKIGNEHPIIGVGAGNLKQEVTRIYNTDYPHIVKQIMPHNQFISVYAGMGIVGLLLFTAAFFYPLFYKKAYQQLLFVVFHLIVFLSFMVENTIETSMGIGFYVFFLCLGLKRWEDWNLKK